MKPIKLKVRGLNSFIEEQIVDFEKLTDRGLFGIFGPTGSGKSTVLDGITLALYGKVARKSSNYVNTNCDSAAVSFEFQISGVNTKRYVVQREFKSTKDMSSVRSGKCKLIDITDGQEDILADTTTDITRKCEEIIGLGIEDFTRTVVLPQGKFSEFLKLEGKDRRNMLERLFSLQQYGDELARKLTGEIARQKEKNSELQGELNGYDDINEEHYEKKKTGLHDTENQLKSISEEAVKVQKTYEIYKETWGYQQQLQELQQQQAVIQEKIPEIKTLEERVKKGESAEKIVPYIEAYQHTLEAIEKAQAKQSEIDSKIQTVTVEKVSIEQAWQILRTQQDEEIPKLTVKKDKVEQALQEKILLDKIENEVKILKITKLDLEGKQKQLNQNIEEVQQSITNLERMIKNDEERIDSIKLDEDFKVKVQEGLRIYTQCKQQLHIVEESKEKIEDLKILIANQVEEEKRLTETLEKKKEVLDDAKREQEEIAANIPGTQEELLALQKETESISDSWSKYNKWTEQSLKIDKEIKNHLVAYELDVAKRSSLEVELESLKIQLKELEKEGLAHQLREDLEQGEVCPVCGSTHHQEENLKYIALTDTGELEREIRIKDKKLKDTDAQVIELKTQIRHLEDQKNTTQQELNDLGEAFKQTTVEEATKCFDTLRHAINTYQARQQSNNGAVHEADKAYLEAEANLKSIQSLLQQNKERLEKDEKQYNKQLEDYQMLQDKYQVLKADIGVENFKEKSNEITKIEKEIEELSKNVKSNRTQYEEALASHKTFVKDQNTVKEELVGIVATLKEKENTLVQYTRSIGEKVTDIEHIVEELEEIEKQINTITTQFKTKDEEKKEIEKNYQILNDEYRSIGGQLQTLNNTHIKNDEKLKKVLEAHSYTSMEQVQKAYLEAKQIEIFKRQIEKHKEDEAKINGAIQNINKSIGDKAITEEQWVEIQEIKANNQKVLEELKEKKAQLEGIVKDIEGKLVQLKKLLEKKQKLEHKLGLLSDLEKLFKGKRFVEFVATTRLKYVSVEASKRLKEITNGNYGLEADENGKFIIRDYKNGGAARDASTLSGGETFLASLALALALSAEIQLKGAAPLELFFLDEGFGTLDDNLLEIVMESLEKVHNDKLKVGIISHVESIKNRVPVKLLLTAAESGKGGSKVKIERS